MPRGSVIGSWSTGTPVVKGVKSLKAVDLHTKNKLNALRHRMKARKWHTEQSFDCCSLQNFATCDMSDGDDYMEGIPVRKEEVAQTSQVPNSLSDNDEASTSDYCSDLRNSMSGPDNALGDHSVPNLAAVKEPISSSFSNKGHESKDPFCNCPIGGHQNHTKTKFCGCKVCSCMENPSEPCGCSCQPQELEDRKIDGLNESLGHKCSEELSETTVSDMKDECEYEREEREVKSMVVRAVIGRNDRKASSCDVIGSVDFDSSFQFFATGGIARKVHIYSVASIMESCTDVSPVPEITRAPEGAAMVPVGLGRKRSNCEAVGEVADREKSAVSKFFTPAKLSSVKWVPNSTNRIGCGDYDGVFTEWDVEKSISVRERDEQNGERIWSVDYSTRSPKISASASDDGSVKLWDSAMESSFAELRTPSGRAVCSVEFKSDSDFTLAMAGLDTGVFLFDLRRTGEPFLRLNGHRRTVSYVRFMADGFLASSSIDGTIRLWDVASPCPGLDNSVRQVAVMSQHQNSKNFVGLSAMPRFRENSRSGFIATGSEGNDVVVYGCRELRKWKVETKVVLNFDFAREEEGSRQPFASAVCWGEVQGKSVLVAANSDGFLQVLSEGE